VFCGKGFPSKTQEVYSMSIRLKNNFFPCSEDYYSTPAIIISLHGKYATLTGYLAVEIIIILTISFQSQWD